MSYNVDERAMALAWLKKRIEDLSHLPGQQAFCAYTHRRTQFVIFCNGARKEEGEKCAPTADLFDLVEKTVEAVRAYAGTIPAPRLLTWRSGPTTEVASDGLDTLYVRLCFEPDLAAALEYVDPGLRDVPLRARSVDHSRPVR